LGSKKYIRAYKMKEPKIIGPRPMKKLPTLWKKLFWSKEWLT